MKTLFLMSGCPGSGKSTLAKKLATEYDAEIVAADDYFINEFGEYIFNRDLLGIAHAMCREHCRLHMTNGTSVICDNTNTVYGEMRPYVKMAVKYGYNVVIAEPQTSWAFDIEQLFVKNTHGVPVETLAKMLARYESVETKKEKMNIYMFNDAQYEKRRDNSVPKVRVLSE